MTGLLDTNVAFYLLGGRLAETLPAGDYGISVITEMELLAYPALTAGEEDHVRQFIANLTPTTAENEIASPNDKR